jgi:hypothetical protein
MARWTIPTFDCLVLYYSDQCGSSFVLLQLPLYGLESFRPKLSLLILLLLFIFRLEGLIVVGDIAEGSSGCVLCVRLVVSMHDSLIFRCDKVPLVMYLDLEIHDAEN